MIYLGYIYIEGYDILRIWYTSKDMINIEGYEKHMNMLLLEEYDIGEWSSEPRKKYMIHMKTKYRPKDKI